VNKKKPPTSGVFKSLATLLAISFPSPEQATAEQDKEDDKRADVKTEQPAIEKNQKQDYNPKNIATCVAPFSLVTASAAKTTEAAK